jgi:hypothetical protein
MLITLGEAPIITIKIVTLLVLILNVHEKNLFGVHASSLFVEQPVLFARPSLTTTPLNSTSHAPHQRTCMSPQRYTRR